MSLAFGFAGTVAFGGAVLLGESVFESSERGGIAVGVAKAASANEARHPLATVQLTADMRQGHARELEAAREARKALLELDEVALDALIQQDASALGSLSLGRANRGSLVNGVELPESPLWHRVEPDKVFGTRETVDALTHAVRRVNATFADTHELWVGHISRERGGWLRPHRSHQSGRDVDLGFYYVDDSRWYVRGTEANLDRPRTWVLLKTLLTETDVEFVFLDRSIQQLLIDYALAIGEDPAWLESVFEGKRRNIQCAVRHVWGHATHMHVRFQSEVSRNVAERAYPALVRAGRLPPGRWYKAR